MSDFHRVPPMKNPHDYVFNHPWDMAIEPFRCAPHVWYVAGQRWVSCFLIDTGDGLILIDAGEAPTVYMLTESIRKAGFDPKDIKKLLISHGHADHCGGIRIMQSLCGGEIYMSKEDNYDKENHFEFVFFPDAGPAHDFKVDHFYSDDEPITLGNITIRTELAPGHTPGTTCFFFDDVDEDGTVYHCGMHGGVGNNPMLTNKWLDDHGYPRSLRRQFIENCRKMRDYDIDICLSSHHNQNNFFSGINENDRSDFSGFVGKHIWKDFMDERIANTEEIDAHEAE